VHRCRSSQDDRKTQRATELEATNLDVSGQGDRRKTIKQSFHTDSHLLAAKPLAQAAVLAEAKRQMATFTPVSAELVRVVPPRWVAVGCAETSRNKRSFRNGDASDLDIDGRLARRCADRRDPAERLFDHFPQHRSVAAHGGE
jgi:hypothetical protein